MKTIYIDADACPVKDETYRVADVFAPVKKAPNYVREKREAVPGVRRVRSRITFDVAIELLRTWGPKLAPLTGSPYELSDYHTAFAAAIDHGRSRAVKTVFHLGAG